MEPVVLRTATLLQRSFSIVPRNWRVTLMGIGTTAVMIAVTFEQPDFPGNSRQDRAVSFSTRRLPFRALGDFG